MRDNKGDNTWLALYFSILALLAQVGLWLIKLTH